MKKIHKLYLTLLLCVTPLLAKDKSYSFIGLQTGISKIDNQEIPSFGLKYGVQQGNARTSFIYNYDKKNSNSFHMLLIQMDTGIFKNSFRNSLLKPYLGATLGMLQAKTNQLAQDRGYVYGLNTGLAYILNDDFDLDFGYRYLKTSKLNNMTEINNINLSIHYFY